MLSDKEKQKIIKEYNRLEKLTRLYNANQPNELFNLYAKLYNDICQYITELSPIDRNYIWNNIK